MDPARTAYDEVYVYSMGRPSFILQHVADVCTVQTANRASQPIAVVFGLVGLCLRVEKGYSGREVQMAHATLARTKRDWPILPLPENRGEKTVADVLVASPGPERDRAIDDWCGSVWTAFETAHDDIRRLIAEYEL